MRIRCEDCIYTVISCQCQSSCLPNFGGLALGCMEADLLQVNIHSAGYFKVYKVCTCFNYGAALLRQRELHSLDRYQCGGLKRRQGRGLTRRLRQGHRRPPPTRHVEVTEPGRLQRLLRFLLRYSRERASNYLTNELSN